MKTITVTHRAADHFDNISADLSEINQNATLDAYEAEIERRLVEYHAGEKIQVEFNRNGLRTIVEVDGEQANQYNTLLDAAFSSEAAWVAA
jgi:flagellar motor protein MotB